MFQSRDYLHKSSNFYQYFLCIIFLLVSCYTIIFSLLILFLTFLRMINFYINHAVFRNLFVYFSVIFYIFYLLSENNTLIFSKAFYNLF